MVKHTQTISGLLPTNCLSVFNLLVGLAFKGLIEIEIQSCIFEVVKMLSLQCLV